MPLPVRPPSPAAPRDVTRSESQGELREERMGHPKTDRSKPEDPRTDSTEEAVSGITKRTPNSLCGYLHKLGGPLRSWKSRWFTYKARKCQLFYYRTPQDPNPLGHIELADATFGFPLQADEGTFHIQTPERTFILKAKNREAMMYWLQQLQQKRWQHRVPAQVCGYAQAVGEQAAPGGCADVNFLPAVKTPTILVGETAATLPAVKQRGTLSNVSFKHPLTEIQNSVHSLRLSLSSQEPTQSTFPWEDVLPPPEEAGTLATLRDSILPVQPESSFDQKSSCPSPSLPSSFSLSPSLSLRSRKKKRGLSATMTADQQKASAADRTSRLQQQVHLLSEEVKAQKELVWLLHKALEAAQQEKRTCVQFLSAEGEQERLELLQSQERHAANLGARLEALHSQKEALHKSLAQRDAHVAELQEHVQLMMERNQAKQEVILKLSEQVAANTAITNGVAAETPGQPQEEIENLKDDIEAYKLQNNFLNSEIYQLTNLWRKSSEQEKSLMVKCAYLEARSCQAESRYLAVLRKLQETKGLDQGEREAVRRLVEEALQGDAKDHLKLDPIREHDDYGFKIIPDYEVEDMKLLARIQALEIRSHNLLQQESGDKTSEARWAQYLGGRPSGELTPSPELKVLLRGGVPPSFRPRVWRWVVRMRTHSHRVRQPGRYRQLCKKGQASQHPAARQIQLDLHRTLTSNERFSSPTSPALKQLHRILMAFSWQNPTIGYCQGLNRLAAIALLVLEDEEEAFWCLVAVVETIMPQDYYSKTLIASQADQRVLKDFMAEKMPRLMAHLEEYSVDVSLVTFNWFMVAFVESLASDILLRVWDAFLYEGTKVLFRYAMAIFKYKEEDILKIHDTIEIYQYLRFFTKTISDGRKLTSIAFHELNPFPMRLLRNRRAQHLERLQADQLELERVQQEFVEENSESIQHTDKELDAVASEDDDA
ncbi:TBC1 domain family member 2A [Scleropages formosus]|uniref:TBC1 domain family member 2 n=1 Tax=Scleropages formosus TaxID=113540 RepID=A0A8C9QTW4_SCLFO|nr:TBC1 domain family member 2A [Scleropages formosus]XP_018615200.1 TBC1 domain family member 2A [Scleropages formosus]